LIVLGQAGGGKSSLAWRLARDLLAQRAPRDRVPLFLPLASWNPEEDLYDWVARKLIRNHPALAALAAGPLGRPPVPLSRALVQNEHLF
jgi:GTPase SAR1 family protein